MQSTNSGCRVGLDARSCFTLSGGDGFDKNVIFEINNNNNNSS